MSPIFCGSYDAVPRLLAIALTANFNGQERTKGTINPGLIYLGEKIQLSVEAIIPVNSASGDGVGFIGALHFHTDELYPSSREKPLFGASPEKEKDEG